MKKREEIEQLKHELGRYMKKVGDQSKEINMLKKQIAIFEKGAEQTHQVMNLIMARVCQTFGTEVLDEDNDNAHIGYRIVMDKPSEELLAKYAIKTEPKEDGKVMVGLVLKEEKHDEG